METEKPKGLRRVPVGMRVGAAVMAVLMIASVFLYDAVRITLRKQADEANVAAAAGNYLLSSTEYVSESTLERAARAIGRVLNKPTTLSDYYNLASVKIAQTKYEDALPLIDVCIEIAEGDPEQSVEASLYLDLLMKKGCLLALLGDYEEALVLFDRVLRLDPAQAQAELLKTQIYVEQGRTDEAIASLLNYIALEPQNVPMREALIRLYYLKNDFLSTEAACGDYLALADDKSGAIHFLRGSSRAQSGSYAGAVEDLLLAIQLGYEETVLCYGQAAICSYLLGDSERVLQYGQEAIKLDAAEFDYGMLYTYMGYASLQLGLFADAEVQFTSAVELGQAEAQMRYFRGVSRMAQEKTEAAIEDFTAAIDGGEATAQSYFNRATCFLQLGNLESAVSDMRQVLVIGGEEELEENARAFLKEVGGVS